MKRSHPDSLDYSVDSQDGAHDQVEDEVNEKRRKRGQSEKKRRDRFNDLLSQLQELIPSASEKKEARKLEKAELLEMAVEYMRNKVLLSKGLPSSSCAESAGQSAIEKHGHTDRFLYRNSVWNKTPQSKKAKGEGKTGGIHFPFMHEVQPRPRQSGFIPFVSGVHTQLGAPHNLLLRSFPAVLQSQSGDIVVREVLEKNFEMRRCCDL